MKTLGFEYNGYPATILFPDNFNGKWVWKTEFLYAFDQAERALFDDGYARVYYAISDQFGSPNAVERMRAFHEYIVKEYALAPKAFLFGFSRGGLYAFNYAAKYPERVEKLYLDAPVLDLKSWPPVGSRDYSLMLAEYGLTEAEFSTFKGSPVDNFSALYETGLPVLLVAGDSDEVVPYEDNGKRLVDYYKARGKAVELYLKAGCGHHPHSLEDVTPIVAFVKNVR